MNPFATFFLIIALGYLLGKINFFGIRFGNSAIILIGILFGHFGAEVPAELGTLGLILFITAVGMKAGKSILYYFKNNGPAFLIIPIVVITSSGLLLFVYMWLFDYPYDLLIGVLSGAMTSTTALASAQELGAGEIAAVGYGIAYIFGVIGVVLFVQLMPKLYKVNREEEIRKLNPPEEMLEEEENDHFIKIDQNGIFVFSLTVALGVLLGSVTVPLGNEITFNLGNSGGPLILGLIIGHLKKVGNISLSIPTKTLNLFSSFGISLFLANSGVTAGAGFVDTINEYGISLFFIGALMTLVTALVGFIVSYYIFKFPIYGALGCTTGGMTSAPSLGALIDSAQTDLVTPFYAATQPIATIALVFLPQVLSLFL